MIKISRSLLQTETKDHLPRSLMKSSLENLASAALYVSAACISLINHKPHLAVSTHATYTDRRRPLTDQACYPQIYFSRNPSFFCVVMKPGMTQLFARGSWQQRFGSSSVANQYLSIIEQTSRDCRRCVCMRNRTPISCRCHVNSNKYSKLRNVDTQLQLTQSEVSVECAFRKTLSCLC